MVDVACEVGLTLTKSAFPIRKFALEYIVGAARRDSSPKEMLNK